MGQGGDALTLAAQRKFRITFGSGLLLIAVTLFIDSKRAIEILTLAGMGLQLWGLVALWYVESSAKKRLRNVNAGH